MSASLKCHICTKEYKTQFTYRRHIKLSHGCIYEHMLTHGVPCSHSECADGGIRFGNMQKYRDHLNDYHHIPDILNCLEFTFHTYEDFVQWKLSQEVSDQANYTVSRGAEKLKCGGVKHVYGCNRSGSYQSRSTGRRQPKAHGTRKIGRTCPSMMIVHHVDGVWIVKYFPTHYGHEQQLQHLSISAKDRLEIADQLSKGITPQNIVNNMLSVYDESRDRRHLPTLKDVANVARAFGLDKREEKEVTEETNSSNTCADSEQNVISVAAELEKTELINKQNFVVDISGQFGRILHELEELRGSVMAEDPAAVAALRHLVHAKRLLNTSRRRNRATDVLTSSSRSTASYTSASPRIWMKMVNKERLIRQKKLGLEANSTKSNCS